MQRMKFLVVGLGNPEGKYFKTWHNLGFVAAEMLAEQLNAEFKKRGNQLIAKHDDIFILKPLTYMNLSGQAVVAVCRKHNIPAENVIVICDDLAIEKGNIRIAFGGSSGGHNGLKSVTELLQTDKYVRVRIGIKPDANCKMETSTYVLSRVDGESQALVDQATDKAVAAVTGLINGQKIEIIQGKYNAKNSQ